MHKRMPYVRCTIELCHALHDAHEKII